MSLSTARSSWSSTVAIDHPAIVPVTPDDLLQPLFETENPSLVNQRVPVVIESRLHRLPKSLLLGMRGGGTPIRVAIFAGFDAARLETVAALARLLLQYSLQPFLAKDYAVFGYPVVNLPGFTEARAPYENTLLRWQESEQAEDALFFQREAGQWGFHVVIHLRSQAQEEFSAVTRSEVLAREVLEPALRQVQPLLSQVRYRVRQLEAGEELRLADFAPVPRAPAAWSSLAPRPFETELTVPAHLEASLASTVLFLATQEILRRYRKVIAFGGEL